MKMILLIILLVFVNQNLINPINYSNNIFPESLHFDNLSLTIKNISLKENNGYIYIYGEYSSYSKNCKYIFFTLDKNKIQIDTQTNNSCKGKIFLQVSNDNIKYLNILKNKVFYLGVIEKTNEISEIKKLILPSIKFKASILDMKLSTSSDGLIIKEIYLKIQNLGPTPIFVSKGFVNVLLNNNTVEYNLIDQCIEYLTTKIIKIKLANAIIKKDRLKKTNVLKIKFEGTKTNLIKYIPETHPKINILDVNYEITTVPAKGIKVTKIKVDIKNTNNYPISADWLEIYINNKRVNYGSVDEIIYPEKNSTITYILTDSPIILSKEIEIIACLGSTCKTITKKVL